MNTLHQTVAGLCLALLAGPAAHAASHAAPSVAADTTAAETKKLHALFERQWEDSAVRFPEFGTFRGDTRFNDRLSDASPAAQAERDRVSDGFMAEAQAI